MKKIISILSAAVLLFAACEVIPTEVPAEPVQAEGTHLDVNFNIICDNPDTKAVKNVWENGDIIHFLFDRYTTDGCYLSLKYNNGLWSPAWADTWVESAPLEERLAAKGSGTVTALYIFNRKGMRWGYYCSEFYAFNAFDDVLGGAENPVYSWYSTCEDAPYQVVDGVLTADIHLTMPAEHDFVQFFIPGITAAPGRFTLETEPAINSIRPVKYYSAGGFQTEENPLRLMPGYAYRDGTHFCGELPAQLNGVSTDYKLILTDTANGAQYEYNVSGKTLSRGKSVKLPERSVWAVKTPPTAHPAYVDLGLPSGIKWATFNLGATLPEELGDSYAWGHTAAEVLSSWSEYRFWVSGSYYSDLVFSKYQTDDGLVTLERADDAASAVWGDKWRMPTLDEWNELQNNCSAQWMNVSGVGCYKVTSQVSGYEDKYIILPDYQNYWSSSLDASDVCDAMSYSASLYSGYGSRMDALFIRPVYDESLEPANPSGPEPNVEFAWIPMCKYGEKTIYVANKNLGAARPSDPGKYYMWGDVTGHLYGDDFYFGVQNYPLAVGSDKYSVYVYSEEPGRWGGAGDAPDNLVQLQPAHDAATAELGTAYHIPTNDEFDCLCNNCEWKWDSARKCCIVRGLNEFSRSEIVIPAGGTIRSSAKDTPTGFESEGCYWLANLGGYYGGSRDNYSCFASEFGCDETYPYVHKYSTRREGGVNIRPVKVE